MGEGKTSALRMHAILFASGLSLMSGVAVLGLLISGPSSSARLAHLGSRNERAAVVQDTTEAAVRPASPWAPTTECER